jgi:hypothetical protein
MVIGSPKLPIISDAETQPKRMLAILPNSSTYLDVHVWCNQGLSGRRTLSREFTEFSHFGCHQYQRFDSASRAYEQNITKPTGIYPFVPVRIRPCLTRLKENLLDSDVYSKDSIVTAIEKRTDQYAIYNLEPCREK